MGIDLKALDRRIRKLQKFREIAAEFQNDPEFAAIIAEFVTSNGNGHKISKTPKPAPVVDSTESVARRPPRGYFIGAVTQAIDGMGGDFTSTDIERAMRDNGVEIVASNPTVAINDVLVTLEKRERIARSGKRGVAVLWKKTSSAEESRTA